MERTLDVPDAYIRRVAIRLRRSRVDPEAVALALGVPRATVACWLAHETRGTYEREPPIRVNRTKK